MGRIHCKENAYLKLSSWEIFFWPFSCAFESLSEILLKICTDLNLNLQYLRNQWYVVLVRWVVNFVDVAGDSWLNIPVLFMFTVKTNLSIFVHVKYQASWILLFWWAKSKHWINIEMCKTPPWTRLLATPLLLICNLYWRILLSIVNKTDLNFI